MNYERFTNEISKEMKEFIEYTMKIFNILENRKLYHNVLIINDIKSIPLNKNDIFSLSILLSSLISNINIKNIFNKINIYYEDILQSFNLENIKLKDLNIEKYEEYFCNYLFPIIKNIKNDYLTKINSKNIQPENIIYSLTNKEKCNSEIIEQIFRELNYIKDVRPLCAHPVFIYINNLLLNNNKIIDIDAFFEKNKYQCSLNDEDIQNINNEDIIKELSDYPLNEIYSDFDFSYIDFKIQFPYIYKYGKILNFEEEFNKPVIGFKNELKNIMELLTFNKSVIISSQSDFCINSIVNDLIYSINNDYTGSISDLIIKLDVDSFLKDIKNNFKTEEEISKFIQELLSSKNSVFYIENFHSIIGKNAVFDKALKYYIYKEKLKVIGSTNNFFYFNIINLKNNFKNIFQKMELNKSDYINCIQILLNYINFLKDEKNISFEINQAVKENILKIIIKITNLIQNEKNPDFSIAILKKAYEYAENINSGYLKIEDIINSIRNCDFIDENIKTKSVEGILKIINNESYFESSNILKFTLKQH